eukprot:3369512-Prymnesium_polylepis.1
MTPRTGRTMITMRGARARSSNTRTMPWPRTQTEGTIQPVQSTSPRIRKTGVHRNHASGSPMLYVESSAATTCENARNSLNLAIIPTLPLNFLM